MGETMHWFKRERPQTSKAPPRKQVIEAGPGEWTLRPDSHFPLTIVCPEKKTAERLNRIITAVWSQDKTLRWAEREIKALIEETGLHCKEVDDYKLRFGSDESVEHLIAATCISAYYDERNWKEQRRAMSDGIIVGWRVSPTTPQPCPICQQAAKKSFPVNTRPRVPLHPGCHCIIESKTDYY